jgi:protein TonB
MFFLQKYLQSALLLFFILLACSPAFPSSDSGAPGIEQTKKSGGRVIPLITVFGSSEGPKFEKRVIPEYPFAAKKRGQEGKVVLRLLIDELGILQEVEVMEATDSLFIQPAVNAVKQSFFIPAKNNKRPVPSKTILPIHFKLKQEGAVGTE